MTEVASTKPATAEGLAARRAYALELHAEYVKVKNDPDAPARELTYQRDAYYAACADAFDYEARLEAQRRAAPELPHVVTDGHGTERGSCCGGTFSVKRGWNTCACGSLTKLAEVAA